jgi:hypothetical protein
MLCCFFNFQLEELILFLSIFIVIIVAFGVSSQALMYPTRQPYALVFRDIFYFPYWSLFGQLFLDEMQGILFVSACAHFFRSL